MPRRRRVQRARGHLGLDLDADTRRLDAGALDVAGDDGSGDGRVGDVASDADASGAPPDATPRTPAVPILEIGPVADSSVRRIAPDENQVDDSDG